jgi:transcriptional regulator with XRE-family HTH domain
VNQISKIENSDQALEILVRKLEEAKARNPNISLRAFSRKIGISSGALSEILKGKRPLSNSLKRRMAQKLMLSPQESLTFFQHDLPQPMGITSDARMTLSQDQFHLISDWWYFGLLNLIKTSNFKNHAGWMARRLGLTVQTVNEAWERLFRLGYLEKKGSQVVRKQPNVKTTDNLSDLSIRKSHLKDLELIEKSILDVPLELRDNTSFTFVIDKKDLSKAKEFIRIFQNQFLNQVAKDSGEEVYKVSVALYPITKVTGEH